jgi:serine/threonine protein kinase
VVALKVAPASAAVAERFAAEARALARLDHPHIVRVYETGRCPGLVWMAMEFIDGGNLRRALAEGRISPPQVLAIVPQVCAALQYAHDQGVVHRDIKPENILIDGAGQVKIADFGLALLRGADGRLTATGAVLGTPHYMAPEQIERPHAVDHRADLYALGVVFYEMLTGELPLGRFAPPSRKVQIDVRLDDVVLRALEKEPEQRYQRAGDLASRVAGLARRRATWPWWAATLVVLAGVLLWTMRPARPAPEPPNPSVTTPMPDPPPVVRDLAWLQDERFTRLAGNFDRALAAELPADALAALWREQGQTYGAFVGFDQPHQQAAERGFRYVVIGHWQLASQELTLAYDDARRLSGLWIRPLP